ncbi:hypothetical protein VCHA53O466_40069 [Vibrio chagasii]|nr:hypothetical protein VCHA53O466_40069 [Vibrio chagasii]
MKFGDLVRGEPQTYFIYECNSPEETNKLSINIQSYATRSKAKVRFETIDGFNKKRQARHLLKVTVETSGQERKKRGPKVKLVA